MTKLSLLIVMILMSTGGFAQQSSSVFVQSNSELQKALDNPQVTEIILGEGYYELLNKTVGYDDDVKVVKDGFMASNDIDQRSSCQYSINSGLSVCGINNEITITVGTTGTGCTSPPTSGTVGWSFVSGPSGTTAADVNWGTGHPYAYSVPVTVDVAGAYFLEYSWGPGEATVIGRYTWNAIPDAPTAINETACYDGNSHSASATAPAGATVVWYDAATGGTVTSAPSGTAAGTYTAWAESADTLSGCVSSTRTEVTLIINAEPEVHIEINDDIVTYGESFEFCYSETVTAELGAIVSGTGPVDITWEVLKDGTLDNTLSGNADDVTTGYEIFSGTLAAGTYTVSLTELFDDNGCSPTNLAAYTATIIIYEEPELDVKINGSSVGFNYDEEFCYNETMSFELGSAMVSGAYDLQSISWTVSPEVTGVLESGSNTDVGAGFNFGFSSQTLPAGTYTFNITEFTDANGCSPSDYTPYTATITINEEPELDLEVNGVSVGFGDSFEFCYPTTVDVSFVGMSSGVAPIDIVWEVNGAQGSATGISAPYSLINQTLDPGFYDIELTSFTDANGCSPADLSPYTMTINIVGANNVEITPIADVSNITGMPVVLDAEISYGNLASQNIDPSVMVDAYIEFNPVLPTNAQILELFYNGTSVATNANIGGVSQVLLSTIIGSGPMPLAGHHGLTDTWTMVIDGVDADDTYEVTLKSIAYTDINTCVSILDDETFNATFAEATISEITDVETCYDNSGISFSWTATYPAVANIGGNQVLNDSRFTFYSDASLSTPTTLPVGTQITVTTPVGNTRTVTLTNPAAVIYGSAIVAQQADPTTNENGYLLSLERGSGTDNWSVNISGGSPGTIYIDFENFAILNVAETGYPFDGEYVYAQQDYAVTINEEPELEMIINGNSVGFNYDEAFCYSETMSFELGTSMVSGDYPLQSIEWTVTPEVTGVLVSGSATNVGSGYNFGFSSQTLPAGTYTFNIAEFTDANGCSPSDYTPYTATITINEEPELDVQVNGSVISFGAPDLDFCENDNILFELSGIVSGTGPFSVSWEVEDDNTSSIVQSGSVTTPATFNPGSPVALYDGTLPVGNYTARLTELTDANGCETSVLSAYEIGINVLAKPFIDAISDQYACEEFDLGTLTITGTGLSGTEAFYDGPQPSGSVISGTITSTQTIYVYDETATGCSDEISFEVTIDQVPVLTIEPDGTWTNDEVFSGGNYVWNLMNDGVYANEHDATFIHPFTGDHTIVYTDDSPNGVCTATETLVITVKPNQLVGQFKYYNAQESPMPSPFMANYNGMDVPDYFWIELIEGSDIRSAYVPVDTVKVEEYYGENGNPLLTDDYYEAAFAFDYNIDPDKDYLIRVWDGGLTEVFGDYEGKLGNSWTWNNWDGVNATDALLISHMVVGNTLTSQPHIQLPTATPAYGSFAQFVADVNSSSSLTALDALLTSRRGIGLIQKFPNNTPNFGVSGLFVDATDFNTNNIFGKEFTAINFSPSGADYVWGTDADDHKYSTDFITLGLGNKYLNVYYNAVGDINASYQPTYGGFKAMPELLVEDEVDVQKGDVITIPVSMDQFATLGAISLHLNFRNDLIEVLGTNYGEDFAKFDNEAGTIAINWFSLEGEHFDADQAIAEITVRVLDDIAADTRLFSLESTTELADTYAKVYDGINFKTIGINASEFGSASSQLRAVTYPNPFVEQTTLSLNLPEDGKLQVVIFNELGVTVQHHSDISMKAGVQTMEINRENLAPGMYQCQVVLVGEKDTYTVNTTMIVVH